MYCYFAEFANQSNPFLVVGIVIQTQPTTPMIMFAYTRMANYQVAAWATAEIKVPIAIKVAAKAIFLMISIHMSTVCLSLDYPQNP